MSRRRGMRTVKRKKLYTGIKTALPFMLAGSAMIQANGNTEEDYILEEVIITGSYIRSQESYTSTVPLSVLGENEIQSTGARDLSNIVQNLAINSGSENQTDGFAQAFTSGTGNINLRNLGLGATLVLLNGRRMPLSSVWAQDGSQFVDINNLPVNMIGRMEIVKDGASALYGSDAVAGVANVITRKVHGLEVSLNYQVTDESNQEDSDISMAWGWGNEDTHVNAFITYFNRTPLALGERDFTHGSILNTNGKPGNFLVLDPMGPPQLLPDPHCGQEGDHIKWDSFLVGAPGSQICVNDQMNANTDFWVLMPEEERISLFADIKHDVSETLEVFAEYNYAKNEVSRANLSSRPFLTTAPFVSAAHPYNPFGRNVLMIPTVRATAEGEEGDTDSFDFEYETHRVSIGGSYEMRNGWVMDTSLTWGRSESFDSMPYLKTDEVNLALNGFGGPDCDPVTGTAGVASCEYFNPFGTSVLDSSHPDYDINAINTEELLSWMKGTTTRDNTSEMLAFEAVTSGKLMDLTHGDLSAAIGIQYRRESLDVIRDEDRIAGAYTFVPAANNFSGARESYAVFGELAVPVLSNLDLSLALRYEDYGADGGSTVDPKVGFGWEPSDSVIVRGSWGTSFRAPTPIHLSSQDSSIQAGDDSCDANANTAPLLTTNLGSGDLTPEGSTAWTLGLGVAVNENLDVSLDYWNYSYEDIIGTESLPSLIANACGQNASSPGDADERLVTSPRPGRSDLIVGADLVYENLGTIDTDGIDVEMRYEMTTELGTFTLSNVASYVKSYEVGDDSGSVDGVGSRNLTNFGRSMPQWRDNLSLNWRLGSHRANITARYIDGYKDDGDDIEIDSQTTVNLQYGYEFDYMDGIDLSLGVTNLFDKEPPIASGNANFDPKVHDPRGRLLYGKMTMRF